MLEALKKYVYGSLETDILGIAFSQGVLRIEIDNTKSLYYLVTEVRQCHGVPGSPLLSSASAVLQLLASPCARPSAPTGVCRQSPETIAFEKFASPAGC